MYVSDAVAREYSEQDVALSKPSRLVIVCL